MQREILPRENAKESQKFVYNLRPEAKGATTEVSTLIPIAHAGPFRA